MKDIKNQVFCSMLSVLLLVNLPITSVYAKEVVSVNNREVADVANTESDLDNTVYTIGDTMDGNVNYTLQNSIMNDEKVEKLVLSGKISEIILWDNYQHCYNSMLHNFCSITPNCPNLKDIDASKSSFRCIDGVLYSQDLSTLLYCPPGKEGELAVPEGVTRIGFLAF